MTLQPGAVATSEVGGYEISSAVVICGYKYCEQTEIATKWVPLSANRVKQAFQVPAVWTTRRQAARTRVTHRSSAASTSGSWKPGIVLNFRVPGGARCFKAGQFGDFADCGCPDRYPPSLSASLGCIAGFAAICVWLAGIGSSIVGSSAVASVVETAIRLDILNEHRKTTATMSVRTRFAPSPTGVLHLGSVRTALFCWLYARHHHGQFVLRIEDTDKERSTRENVDAILEGMAWLGLDADEGPFFQSQRIDRYREVRDQWLDSGKAYHCFCTKQEIDELRAGQMERGERVRYDGRCRDRTEPREGVTPVVRFKNPLDGEVVVNDAVRGRVVFENTQLDDLIIA